MSDHGHGDGHGKAEGPVKKVWKTIGIVLAVLLGVVVLFWVAGALMPSVFDGLNNVLAIFNSGFTQAGMRLNMLGSSIGTMMMGFFATFIKILFMILLFLGALEIFKILKSKMGGGGGHGDGHH